MADNERIISKIKKVLELSKNNPSKEEAIAAAALAHKLMAEYHLELADVEGVTDVDKVHEEHVNIGKGNKWKYALAGILAKNFRCKHFYYGKETVVFYGYKLDTQIAASTFRFLFTYGNKMATNYYNKIRNQGLYTKGVKNAFYIGYLEGIQEVLERQCTALMVVTPPEIEQKYQDRISGCKKMQNSGLSYNGGNTGMDAREEGRFTGKNAVQQRSIESKF